MWDNTEDFYVHTWMDGWMRTSVRGRKPSLRIIHWPLLPPPIHIHIWWIWIDFGVKKKTSRKRMGTRTTIQSVSGKDTIKADAFNSLKAKLKGFKGFVFAQAQYSCKKLWQYSHLNLAEEQTRRRWSGPGRICCYLGSARRRLRGKRRRAGVPLPGWKSTTWSGWSRWIIPHP